MPTKVTLSSRSGEPLVARKQWCVERFGKGDINGVVGREIVPQIPDTRQQEIMRVSAEGKVSEVGKSRAAALVVDLALCRVPADDLRDFDIEQMRRMQRLSRFEQPFFHHPCRRCTKERFEQGRGIDDDHWRSRSARTA